MISNLYNKIYGLPDDIKITSLFRFISFIFTSCFYIILNFNHSLNRKIFILTCIAISELLLTYLYPKVKEASEKIFILLTVETIGNAFVLIHSGGIESPFIWLSLNTILLSSLELKKIYSWLNLLIYLTSATYFNLFYYRSSNFNDLLKLEIKSIHSLIIITIAFQIISEKIKELNRSNITLKQKMDYSMQIYQSVHYFTNSKEIENLINIILDYTMKITRTEYAVFFSLDNQKFIAYDLPDNNHFKISLLQYTNEMIEKNDIITKEIGDSKILLCPIKSDYKTYGILGFKINSYEENIEQIKFLAELSTLSFERIFIEDLKEKMLISKEQNRIANEIHDNVIQRLFSISCKLYSIFKNSDKIDKENIARELIDIRNSIDATMRYLRETIYGLSWNKNGNDSFLTEIDKFINEMSFINNSSINFSITGSVELLSILQKKALYRIICESISNAVRHGKAKKIDIELNISKKQTSLTIKDDGRGFKIIKPVNEQNMGIGLKNIKTLVDILKGNLEIKSEIGRGTDLFINIKNGNIKDLEEII